MQDSGFKHITVNAPGEEDVVIRAGVVSDQPGQAGEVKPALDVAEGESGSAALEGGVIEAASTAAGEADAGDHDATGAPAAETEAEDAPARRPGRSGETEKEGVGETATGPASQKRLPAKKDEYRATTLEDLRGKPMPTVQKVVIIAAVLCIIGALVYYLVFMR